MSELHMYAGMCVLSAAVIGPLLYSHGLSIPLVILGALASGPLLIVYSYGLAWTMFGLEEL